MLKFVTFYNELTESMYDGFVLTEDKDSFELIDPICYEWIVKKNKEEWFDLLSPRHFDKQFFHYTEQTLPPSWSFIRNHEWLLDYEVKPEHLPDVHAIANFFEWFAGQRSGTVTERLERANSKTRYILSESIQQDVAQFIHAYYKKNRLRFLANGVEVE